MISDLIQELRDGLENVTPGPWTWGQKYVCRRDGDKYVRLFNTPDDEQAPEGSQWEIDAAHVARCHPDNIRSLLDTLAANDKEFAEIAGKIEQTRVELGETQLVLATTERNCEAEIAEIRAENERLRAGIADIELDIHLASGIAGYDLKPALAKIRSLGLLDGSE